MTITNEKRRREVLLRRKMTQYNDKYYEIIFYARHRVILITGSHKTNEYFKSLSGFISSNSAWPITKQRQTLQL